MQISLNWLKQFTPIPITTQSLITKIGTHLVEVESITDQTHKYDNIYIVQITTAEKIPATHLTLCQINTGQSTTQVLCGAPNVKAGMLAVWLAPGATVPASAQADAPFIIGTRKIRGLDSHGMLASAAELDFGPDHSGIVEIDPQTAKPGDKLADLFDLNDTILDIENKSLTHRPDAFGIIGFAREIAGILGQPFTTPAFLTTPQPIPTTHHAPAPKITITDPTLCPRYEALVMHQKHSPTTKYLTKITTLLARSGIRPIDPIVDLTNYLMLLTGQPLHAFDYDKLIAVGGHPTPEIIVRPARPDESLTLLDGKTIKTTPSDILITSHNVPIALAGAMGGANTAIDSSTTRIIVESATFSLYNLRKTQMTHGIFTEAITRFTKGQPPALTDPVIREFSHLLAPSFTTLSLTDTYPHPTPPPVVKITTPKINSLLGTTYSGNTIKTTLENVNFSIKSNADTLTITPPYWRTDIHIPEDIVEEVGRLLGYDSIPQSLPLRPFTTAPIDPLLALKSRLRTTLAAAGANELLTYSFVPATLLKKVNQSPANSYQIINSLSPDLAYIRQQLAPSLLEKASENLKSGHHAFTLFEIGQIFIKSEGLDPENVPKLYNNLALVTLDSTSKHTLYYTAKKYLETLATALNITLTLTPFHPDAIDSIYEPKRSAAIFIGKSKVGVIGEITATTAKNLKLPPTTAALELDLALLQTHQSPTTTIPPLSKYPPVDRDLTLKLPQNTPYQKVATLIESTLDAAALIATLTPTSIYQAPHHPTKNLAFHLTFSHPKKTLSSTEINAIIDSISKKSKDELGAEVI